MTAADRSSTADRTANDDEATLVARVERQDPTAFEAVMRRYNSRLFRIARAILRNDAEAEDALQDAYLAAFRHMGDFRGGSHLATWLTTIVVNQALTRLRKQRRERVIVPFREPTDREGGRADVDVPDVAAESASGAMLRAELRQVIERRIDQLPIAFRTVFVMREVEEMTFEQIAESLSVPAATVRTRLFRARALLREGLARDTDLVTSELFGFAGDRCDRIVAAVLARVSASPSGEGNSTGLRCDPKV